MKKFLTLDKNWGARTPLRINQEGPSDGEYAQRLIGPDISDAADIAFAAALVLVEADHLVVD